MSLNKDILNKSNISYWHNKGYEGQGLFIVLLDFFEGKYAKHGKEMKAIIEECLPKATIECIDVEDTDRYQYIVDNEDKIDIVNCSFGSRLALDFLLKFKDLDIPFICAGGNEHNNKLNQPASFDFTIAIGAYSDFFKKVANFSNAGEELDAVTYNQFLFKFGDDPAFTTNGTSASTAFATGMIGIMLTWAKEQGLKLDREQVRKFIHSNSEDLMEEGRDNKSGYGLFKLPTEFKGEDFINNMKGSYKDMVGHWGEDVVRRVSEAGIMNGFPDGTFKPEERVTRVQQAAIISRLLERIERLEEVVESQKSGKSNECSIGKRS